MPSRRTGGKDDSLRGVGRARRRRFRKVADHAMSVRKSLAWSYGGQAFTFLVTFASSVIVARLLSPREMGVFAIAAATAAILSVLTQFSISAYLVREGELTKELIRSVYTVNGAMSVLLSLLTLGAAAFCALVLGQGDVGAVLALTAIGPLLGVFEFVPATLYAREMQYGILTRVNMVRAVIIAVTTVACAYGGMGSLSLAVGPLVAGVFSLTFYNWKRRRDVILRPTRRGLKPIVVFGFQIMSISGVAHITQHLSSVILGRMLGLTALGLYSRASSVAGLVYSNVYGLATGVIFTKLSNDLREKGTLYDTYLRSMKLITAALWPLMLGLAVLAKPAVHILYGDKWLPAALPLSVLMIWQFIALGFGMNWELFVLRRETATQTRYEAIRAAVGLAAFTAGCFFSITAAAAGRVADVVVGYFLYRPHIDRLAGTDPGELEGVLRESLALTAVAVAPALVLMLWSGWAADTPPLLIAGAVALGAGGWGAMLMARRHPLLIEAELALARLRRPRAPLWTDLV